MLYGRSYGGKPANDPLRDGDVVVADRGDNSASALIACADRGVAVVVRYNPHGLKLYDAEAAQIDWLAQLQRTTETEWCLPVRVQVNGEFIEGTVHGGRLPPALPPGIRAAIDSPQLGSVGIDQPAWRP